MDLVGGGAGDFQLFSRGLVNLERWVAGGELVGAYDNEVTSI